MRKKTFSLVCSLLIACACTHVSNTEIAADSLPTVTNDEASLVSGDLLFVGGDSRMDEAIMASTGFFTHVAIVERVGEELFIIESTPRRGVTRRPINDFYADIMLTDSTQPSVFGMRASVPFNVDEVLAKAKKHIGETYDSTMLPGNSAVYCSELVTESYIDNEGVPIFELHSMNFRDAEGNMPPYWEEWFGRIGSKIPEGVLGSNPNDMFRSSKLQMVCRL